MQLQLEELRKDSQNNKGELRRNDQHTTSEETERKVVMEEKVEAPLLNEGNFEDVDIEMEEKEEMYGSEEEEDLSSLVKGSRQGIIPSELAIEIWKKGRQVGCEWGAEDWKNITMSSLINKYTKHPKAEVFTAQIVDEELPDLQSQDKKLMEQRLGQIQVLFL